MKWINYLEKPFPRDREVAVKWGTKHASSFDLDDPSSFGMGETDYLIWSGEAIKIGKTDIYWLDESGPPEGYERIDVKIGSYIMPPPTEYMKTPKAEYPSLEYVVLTELHDDLIEKYETLLAKYNTLKQDFDANCN